jgi:hypothetical protein
MRNGRAKICFILSLCLASFGYGMATIYWQVFPFTLLQNADRAWGALSVVAADQSSRDVADCPDLTLPTIRHHSDSAGDELILVAGGKDFLKQHSPEHGCLAWIMDRQGNVVHVWHYDPEIWAHLERVVTVPGQSRQVYPVGMHLYPDGELLVSFQGYDVFPYGIGLAKFDKNSKLLWKKELFSHHWFTVAPDGRIITPAVRSIDSPYQVGDTRFSISSPDSKVLEDTVMILDAQGQVLDEIVVLEAVIKSGWTGLLPTVNASEDGKRNHERFVIGSGMAGDPTHLNGVQLVDRELAAAHGGLSEGDLLLSLRNMNAIGILDPHTKRFKWMSAGASVQQHSPRFYENGVLVLDNRGGPEASGGSRLVLVDLDSHLPQTLFPRPESSLPGTFYTSASGQFELGDSDRALVAITLDNKIWEINLKTGQVLWEYRCVDAQQQCFRSISTAHYVGRVNFAFNKQGERGL